MPREEKGAFSKIGKPMGETCPHPRPLMDDGEVVEDAERLRLKKG